MKVVFDVSAIGLARRLRPMWTATMTRVDVAQVACGLDIELKLESLWHCATSLWIGMHGKTSRHADG